MLMIGRTGTVQMTYVLCFLLCDLIPAENPTIGRDIVSEAPAPFHCLPSRTDFVALQFEDVVVNRFAPLHSCDD